MDLHLIRECVETLKALRTLKHEELDASTAAELDEVIYLLEECIRNGDEVAVDGPLSMRTLRVIDECLTACTNITVNRSGIPGDSIS